jgi:hypothetical protein
MLVKKMKVYTLQRKDPKTGFNETIQYTGSLKNKPKGYRVIKEEIQNKPDSRTGLHYS